MSNNTLITESADVADGTSATTTSAPATPTPATKPTKPAKSTAESAGTAPKQPKPTADSGTRDTQGRFTAKNTVDDGSEEDGTGNVDDSVDESDEIAEDKGGDDEGEDEPHPLSGMDYEEVMRQFRGGGDPKPKKAAKPVEPEEDDEDIDDEDEYEDDEPIQKPKARTPKGDLAARIRKVAEEVDPEVASLLEEMHSQLTGITSQAQKQKQQQYEKMVHTTFDQFAEETGSTKIYGNTASKMTKEQYLARQMVHDMAVDLFKRLGGKKISGKIFTEQDAFEAAHKTAFGTESRYTDKQVETFKARHMSRKPVGRGSNAGEADLPENPDDVDGTAPPKRRR